MGDKHRVVIAEDQRILRDGLSSMLSGKENFEVVGTAEDGIEAIRAVRELKPDIVLLDHSMPRMDGISAIREIKRTSPNTKILLLTIHDSEEHILHAFQSGADGYCLKEAAYRELLIAIQSVLSGKPYISPGISDKVLVGYLKGAEIPSSDPQWESLTSREKEILKLVGEGYKNTDIADYLCISVKTVEKHRANIMGKLDLHTASALTAYAVKKGLVTKPLRSSAAEYEEYD